MTKREVVARELKQKRIDISNLRFYSQMALEFKWQTDVIDFRVIEKTLSEIANRLGYEVALCELPEETGNSPDPDFEDHCHTCGETPEDCNCPQL